MLPIELRSGGSRGVGLPPSENFTFVHVNLRPKFLILKN